VDVPARTAVALARVVVGVIAVGIGIGIVIVVVIDIIASSSRRSLSRRSVRARDPSGWVRPVGSIGDGVPGGLVWYHGQSEGHERSE
jgi:hypothetical protein